MYLLPIYSLALILFSSALTSQFLAIAAIGAAVFLNFGFMIFFMLQTIFLMADPAGLDLEIINQFIDLERWNSWNTAPALLTLGVLQFAFSRQRVKFG